MKGTLYVVATPIGNLKDITLRSIDTLRSVAFILCEDTRVSSKLVRMLEIDTQLISYRDQNHNRIVQKIIEKLDMGLNLALISDAGTPTISDPGYKLCRDLRAKGYDILPIPGPDAVSSALSVSGLPTDRYLFIGFLPKGEGKRVKELTDLKSLDATLVIYESPNRLFKLLSEISTSLGNRYISICNDMTKMYESYEVGYVNDLIERSRFKVSQKGEFVVLVSKEEI